MSGRKNRRLLKKLPFGLIGILLLLFAAVMLLFTSTTTSIQSRPTVCPKVFFWGDYRIGEGPWQPIEERKHIPATKGDVRLRGEFHMVSPDGEYIGPVEHGITVAIFSDHVNVTICEGENEPYVMDNENPLFGTAACGRAWAGYHVQGGASERIELMIHNPHRFGNDTAVDQLLSNLSVWNGIEFERDVMERGELQKNTGLLFIIVAFVLLGTALFSTLLHIKSGRNIWLLGLAIFFAGAYLVFNSIGTFFWNQSVVANTTVLGISMMFYMLFLLAGLTTLLKLKKKSGRITVIALGAADLVFFLLPIFTDIAFYDMWLPWVMVQTAANVWMIGCLIKESLHGKKWWIYAAAILSLLAFEGDAAATALGLWKGGRLSVNVFVALVAAALVMVWRMIPKSINASNKAKELETEQKILRTQLQENRIAIMISQIQPHFIYNTLGTIEQLCREKPEEAAVLVRNFSLYLRGNFSELDKTTPICFEQEMEHVKHYVNIEQVRFPDMTVQYDLRHVDFMLPALTVQPLVENAIKHGLMGLEIGGTVTITSYETQTHSCICVADNGVGFDPEKLTEGAGIGLKNIRGRLEAMLNGVLTVESVPGEGTRARIMIPKE